jgi:hypothetical protein
MFNQFIRDFLGLGVYRGAVGRQFFDERLPDQDSVHLSTHRAD